MLVANTCRNCGKELTFSKRFCSYECQEEYRIISAELWNAIRLKKELLRQRKA